MILKNLEGHKFGNWTVVKKLDNGRRIKWLCRCKCGREKAVQSNHLISGQSKACGCTRPGRPRKIDKNIRLLETNMCLICGGKFPAWKIYPYAPSKLRRNESRFCSIQCSVVYRVDQSNFWGVRAVKVKEENLRTAFGETKSVRGWSKDPRCIVSYETLSERLSRLKWDIEKAILTPPIYNRKQRDPELEEFGNAIVQAITKMCAA